MKKLIAIAALLIMSTGASGALAAKGGNSETPKEDRNKHGLCTAYFNGQKNGHDKDGTEGDPGPFRQLEVGSNPEDDDDEEGLSAEEIAASVYEYCQGFGIGGNEDHGRYACALTTEDDPETEEDETDYTCTLNPAPNEG